MQKSHDFSEFGIIVAFLSRIISCILLYSCGGVLPESTFDLSSMQSKPIVSRIKKTLTIVVVCDVLGQENNGTTIAAMHLIRALRNKGHHVRVVCSDIFRVGEQDYYIVPQLNLGPINRYVKKNGVVPATPDKRILDAAMDGADLVHIMMPLALANIGEENTVKKISGNQDVKQHLENLGFVVGGNVTVITALNGNVIVKVKESRVAISEEMARKIMV